MKTKEISARKIKDLTEHQFKELLESMIKGNCISVSGIEVSSATASLDIVEKTINRLVEKHQEFLLLRKEQQMKTGYTG